MATTPAYAQVKTITSISGAQATHKHVKTLRRAQELLKAQGDQEAVQASYAIERTLTGYYLALQAFYKSEYYPYRRVSA